MAAGPNRRDVITGGAAALGLFLIGGQRVWATPSEAVARGFTPQILTRAQVEALTSLADHLVPGSAKSGIGAYIDAQLAAGPESLLMAKYVGVPVEQQTTFYLSALNAVTNALKEGSVDAVSTNMATDTVPDWQGPPASYVFFLLRADALDVTYGSEAGFADLGIPYSAHIRPETTW
jgi:hypothetical protein